MSKKTNIFVLLPLLFLFFAFSTRYLFAQTFVCSYFNGSACVNSNSAETCYSYRQENPSIVYEDKASCLAEHPATINPPVTSTPICTIYSGGGCVNMTDQETCDSYKLLYPEDWYSNIDSCTSDDRSTPPDPFDLSSGDPHEITADKIDSILDGIISKLTPIAGLLAFAFVVYGAYMWMMSAGDPEKIKRSQGIIQWAVLGLIFVIITSLVITAILNAVQ